MYEECKHRLRGQAEASSSSSAGLRASSRAKKPRRWGGKPWQRRGKALGELMGSYLTQSTEFPLDWNVLKMLLDLLHLHPKMPFWFAHEANAANSFRARQGDRTSSFPPAAALVAIPPGSGFTRSPSADTAGVTLQHPWNLAGVWLFLFSEADHGFRPFFQPLFSLPSYMVPTKTVRTLGIRD